MSFAQRMGGVADRLLAKYDERTVKAVLITPGAKTYNPAIGDYETTPATEQDLTGVATSFSQSLIANGTVQAGDIRFVSTRAVKPTQADSVRMDGVTYGVVILDPKAYTGLDLTICYVIGLRK